MWIPIFRQDRRDPALLPSLDGGPPNDQLPDSIAFQLTIALLWFAFWASEFSRELSVPFVYLFPALLAAALIFGIVALMLLVRWARRKDVRLGQFSIATGLFLLLVFATIFAFSHWAAGQAILGFSHWWSNQPSAVQRTNWTSGPRSYGSWIAISMVIVIFSIPFTIWLVHSALWGSIWVLRRRRHISLERETDLAKKSTTSKQATSLADELTQ